jgi:hypothetical protein
VTSTRTGAAKRRPGGKPAKARASRQTPKQRTKPRARRAKLTWDGITMTIRYQPEYFTGHDHLEIQVIAPERSAPLPITDTGYRSHFLRPGIVDEAGGPAAYVRRWLDEAARQPSWRTIRARWRQLSLF